MAKKVVATLQSKSKKFTKVIRAVKNPKTGHYSFEEKVMNADDAKAYLKK
jgi:hemerythrin